MECGGFKVLNWDSKCFDYIPSDKFPDLETWWESFPHVYMMFEPNALIPIYPRDYFFLENSQQCMGFAYLDSRIILGSIFMRNFDVQFNRDNGTVKMVRADCSPESDFNFSSYYMHHTDHRPQGQRPAKQSASNQPRKSLDDADVDLYQWSCFLIFCCLAVVLLAYSIYCRRYKDRHAGINEFQRIENAVEI